MAFLHRRFFSTSVRNRQNLAHYQSIRPKLSTPSPTSMGAVLDSPELKQLAEKAKGSWKEFTKEEAVKLYRASFPMTFKEIRAGPGHYRIVIPAVAVGVAIGYFVSEFLKNTVGPTIPHTINNPEWEADARERNIRQRANPISGISSKVHINT